MPVCRQMKFLWIGARMIVVPAGRPSMIMCTWVGLRYSQPTGGSVTVPEPVFG